METSQLKQLKPIGKVTEPVVVAVAFVRTIVKVFAVGVIEATVAPAAAVGCA